VIGKLKLSSDAHIPLSIGTSKNLVGRYIENKYLYIFPIRPILVYEFLKYSKYYSLKVSIQNYLINLEEDHLGRFYLSYCHFLQPATPRTSRK
jgi:hypothetical protein